MTMLNWGAPGDSPPATTYRVPGPGHPLWRDLLPDVPDGPAISGGSMQSGESARYAAATVGYYGALSRAGEAALSQNVRGLLADLMHLADLAGFDFARELSCAADDYEQDLHARLSWPA